METVISTCGTNNPYEIADMNNISIEYALFENIDAVYSNVLGYKLIVLDERITNDIHKDFIVAHEIYHAIEHEDTVAFYHHAKNAKSRKEREANEFATKLLAYGFCIEEGTTKYDIMRERGIPEEMERFII
ncbi:ImmA/IrrE family metallo-endopeptidase [Aerococcaceae bacterium NML190073]|nr:ImmA/IrrE family metallo-endopeptidase [Aerococcaceae bacterium NML190073]